MWHQNYDDPAGNNACHYVWSMPKDDLLVGYSSFNKIQWARNDIQNDTLTSIQNDVTLQREQAATLFLRCLGVPWMNHRFVAVYVNGTLRGKLMEDACRPTAGEFQDEYCSDDSDGQYYKIQRWGPLGLSTTLISECMLQQYLTTGNAQKPARYRPNWSLKTTSGSLSDFTNLYTLITAATAYNQANYADLLDNVIDGENWMRLSAAQHAAGNWDGFGSTTGQNVDTWVSAHHRWPLFLIDFGICLDNNLSGVGLFSMSDPAWSQMLSRPKFGRMYYRALTSSWTVCDMNQLHPGRRGPASSLGPRCNWWTLLATIRASPTGPPARRSVARPARPTPSQPPWLNSRRVWLNEVQARQRHRPGGQLRRARAVGGALQQSGTNSRSAWRVTT